MNDAVPGRLCHRGLIYDSPRHLADIVGPTVRVALDGGIPVYALVSDDTASALYAVAGPRAEWIRFQPPSVLSRLSIQSFLGRLSAWSGSDRPVLVVGQYAANGVSDAECAIMEDGVNLVLADRPLTLLCACARTDGPGPLATAHRVHPAWVTARDEVPNRDFAAPADRCPVPADMWGRVVMRTTFCGLSDLARIRHHVVELVHETGFRGTDAESAVLAVHEAAVLACTAETGRPVERDATAWTIEVRTTGTALFSEVRFLDTPMARLQSDLHTVLGAPVCDADALRHLYWFCHRASIDSSGPTRTIRVLVDGSRRLAYHGLPA